jgi:hypothetical protein
MRESESFHRKRKVSTCGYLNNHDTNLLYLRETISDRYECMCCLYQTQYDKTLTKQYKADPPECTEIH